jgi:4-amino-4-deoxy-L-arabinose transferase-like glycosyltransferase
VAVVLLALLAVSFVGRNAADIQLPFGQSDEGLNAAVWGEGSRSYRELGPITSVFGGRRIDGRAYATHPPLLLTEAAAVEWIAGEHRWITRAPAWIGALAGIPLLYLLLRRLRVRAALAASAVVAGLGTPMFFVYGWMLDTPVVAFPLAVAAAAIWQGRRAEEEATARGAAGPGTRSVVAISVLVGVAGWQASLFVGLLAVWTLASARRNDRPTTEARAWFGGLFAGLAISLGWCWWVYGDLQVLKEKFFLRTAGESLSITDMVRYQSRWTALLLGAGLIGLAWAIAALRDPRFRPLTACALASVVLYNVVFHSAAAAHPFWGYQILLSVVLGYGYFFEHLHRRLARDGLPALSSVVALACLVAAIGAIPASSPRQSIRAGTTPVTLLRPALSPSQDVVGYLGDLTMPDDWILYEFRRPAHALTSDDLRRLGNSAPADVVLVAGPCTANNDLCAAVWRDVPGQNGYEVITASEATRRLDAAGN